MAQVIKTILTTMGDQYLRGYSTGDIKFSLKKVTVSSSLLTENELRNTATSVPDVWLTLNKDTPEFNQRVSFHVNSDNSITYKVKLLEQDPTSQLSHNIGVISLWYEVESTPPATNQEIVFAHLMLNPLVEKSQGSVQEFYITVNVTNLAVSMSMYTQNLDETSIPTRFSQRDIPEAKLSFYDHYALTSHTTDDTSLGTLTPSIALKSHNGSITLDEDPKWEFLYPFDSVIVNPTKTGSIDNYESMSLNHSTGKFYKSTIYGYPTSNDINMSAGIYNQGSLVKNKIILQDDHPLVPLDKNVKVFVDEDGEFTYIANNSSVEKYFVSGVEVQVAGSDYTSGLFEVPLDNGLKVAISNRLGAIESAAIKDSGVFDNTDYNNVVVPGGTGGILTLTYSLFTVKNKFVGITGEDGRTINLSNTYIPEASEDNIGFTRYANSSDRKYKANSSDFHSVYPNDLTLSYWASHEIFPRKDAYEEITGIWKFNNLIEGTARYAVWAQGADLAEMYESDYQYPAGTLICFDGEKEITIATTYAEAVVSTEEAFTLGKTDVTEGKIPVALVGKVKVLIDGETEIKKGDFLYLSKVKNGTASNIENGKKLGKVLSVHDNYVIAVVQLGF